MDNVLLNRFFLEQAFHFCFCQLAVRFDIIQINAEIGFFAFDRIFFYAVQVGVKRL